MGPYHLAALAALGVFAGAVNTIAGAGSLLTYPVLVGFGLSPLAANVTNDIGVVPGNLAGAAGLHAELRGQRDLLRRLVPRVVIGSLIGAGLLLVAPSSAFAWAAPPLILIASVLTLAQPALKRLSARSRAGRSGRALGSAIDVIAVYGGYFGTGIGLLFMAVLGVFVDEGTHRLNAVKTVLQFLANGLAGVVFALVAPVHWEVAALLAAGSLVGGQLGALLSGKIPAAGLRATVAVIGMGAGIWLLIERVS